MMNCRVLCLLTQQLLSARLEKKKKAKMGEWVPTLVQVLL